LLPNEEIFSPAACGLRADGKQPESACKKIDTSLAAWNTVIGKLNDKRIQLITR
jgi:hypothetical protein